MERGHYLHKGSVLYEPFYNGIGIRNYSAFWKRQKDNLAHIQRLALWKKLDVHDGCVNSIAWNESGSLLLSGSDDHKLVISNPFTSKTEVVIPSGHRANIFSACFFPSSDDKQIVSCCGSGEIRYTLVDREETWGKHLFNCHFGTAYDVATIPSEPHTFLSCGEDNTVRFFDLRVKTSCTKRNCQDDVLIRFRRGVTALSVNPRQSYYLATGSSDSVVRCFDRRMISAPRGTSDFSSLGVVSLFRAPAAVTNSPITCVKFADDGCECLVSYSGDHLYLFSSQNTMQLDDISGVSRSLSGGQQSPTVGGVSTSSLLPSQQQQQQSVKRLRLRGDWSDTGPLARPESERRVHQPSNVEEEREQRFYSTMQRVSDMLTNWLVNYMNRQPSPSGSPNASSPNAADNNNASGSNNNNNNNSSDSPIAALPPALAPVASLLAAANNSVQAEQQERRQRSRSSSLSANRTQQQEDDSDNEVVVARADGQEQEEDEADEEDESGSGASSNSHRRGSDDTGDADDERTIAAMRVQRYFRRRAKERKRQQREWGQVPHCRQIQKYVGHRSVRTMIKEANFWGNDYIISGSDCGHVFFWDRHTGRVVNVIEADRHVVNCVQPHQHLPLLAASGIDYDIKLLAPVLPVASEDIEERAAEICRRNALMLEESRDTLTVPASFMLRVLAAFNHISGSNAAPGAGGGGGGGAAAADGNAGGNNGGASS